MGVDRTDLHFHLLPGLDDGPASVEESFALARLAVEDGTRSIVATPHVRPEYVTNVDDLPDRARALEERLAGEDISLRVSAGAELGHEMVGRLGQDELRSVSVGPPDAPWVLVECPFAGLDHDLHAATRELRERGFGVVLAHPERSTGVLAERLGRLEHELRHGSLLQVNALSLAGDYGPAARTAGEDLVRGGVVSVLASDAHSPRRRPALRTGERLVERLGLSRRAARRLTHERPHALLRHGVPTRRTHAGAR